MGLVLATFLVVGCRAFHDPDEGYRQVEVLVNFHGNGAGTVIGSFESGDEVFRCTVVSGVAGNTPCIANFRIHADKKLNLKAEAPAGSDFRIWGQDCAAFGSDSTCTLNPERINLSFTWNVSARFELHPGAIKVVTHTSGSSLDPDGYAFSIGPSAAQDIGVNDSTTVSGLVPGDHEVRLTGVSDSCIPDVNEQTVRVDPDGLARAEFFIVCSPVGSIQVVTQTSGSDQDPNGYKIHVDGGSEGAIGLKETITISEVTPGDRWVELTDVATNCTVAPPNGRSVVVSPDATAQTTFVIDCAPLVDPTFIEVITVTTGDDLDSNGYSWTVKNDPQYFNGPIEVNETVSVLVEGGGDYEVQLYDVDPNCKLDTLTVPNPRVITVETGETAGATFSVGCNPWGGIQVSNQTAGWDFDPFGYTVDVDGSGIGILMPNETQTFTNFLAGNYDIKLRNLSRNCAVQPNDTIVNVTWGNTASANFRVACSGIVFQSNRDGFMELYAMNSDGTGLQRILPSVHHDENPAWSPDRAHVVFVSDRDGDQEIYVLTLSDSSLVKVTDNIWEDDDPVWSPSGDSILFASDRGGGEKDLYLKSADGQGLARRITNTPAADEDDADWSPVDPLGGGAQWIVFSSDGDPDGDDELYKLDISQDPAGARIKLTSNAVKDDDPVWSPDGTKIAFSRRTNGDDRDVFVMNADGSGVVQLTIYLGDDDDPSWSPDGTMIAFMSNRDGNDEIYVMNADGSGKTRLTVHASKDDEPGWRR